MPEEGEEVGVVGRGVAAEGGGVRRIWPLYGKVVPAAVGEKLEQSGEI